MNLRDALLASLQNLPGSREFHIHVLVTSPRKHSAIFQFAQPRPRTYLQDILILLSEQSTPGSPRIFVTGIEASVYYIPSTSCGILYVSKVDTTGHALHPSPAAILVRTLITFYGDPKTRPIAADHLWVHLFARAQGQYLFPNSVEWAGKRPLSDVRLCAWWKRVLSEVAEELDTRTGKKATVELHYVLPGYTELEATNSLRAGHATSVTTNTSVSWTYGHPYSHSDIPLPCPKCSGQQQNLGHFIPCFDDDPKSRFMDEIAYTTSADSVTSPKPKRPRAFTRGEEGSSANSPAPTVDEKDGKNNRPPLGELGTVTPDEFWERMSFRQECVAGAVTGFFTLAFSLPYPKELPSSPLAPQPGQVSSQVNKRIVSSLLTGVEFSTLERSIRGTEMLEGVIKGLCEDLPTPAPIVHTQNVIDFLSGSGRQTPEREEPLTTSLPGTPPNGKRQVEDVSPNPFPEPVTSLESYYSYIYGSICVRNPATISRSGEKRTRDGNGKSEPSVTVLSVRKKKKKNN